MNIFHLACLNNDPEIQPNMDPKCNPVGGEPLTDSRIIIEMNMLSTCPLLYTTNRVRSGVCP